MIIAITSYDSNLTIPADISQQIDVLTGDFSELFTDCDNAASIYCFNIRHIYNALTNKAQSMTDEEKEIAGETICKLIVPFVTEVALDIIGVRADILNPPKPVHTYYLQYILSAAEKSFLDSFTHKEDLDFIIQLNKYPTTFNTDNDILEFVLSQDDNKKIYILTVT